MALWIIHEGNLFNDSKVNIWENANICVEGKPEWKFIKIFTHGALEKNHDAVFGKNAKLLFNQIIQKYKNNNKYLLHFVTAREMYNIIKAAEHGCTDDPNVYRDYQIKRYKNTL